MRRCTHSVGIGGSLSTITDAHDDAAAILERERQRLTQDIAALDRTHDAIVEARDTGSTDDEHDPDGSTIAFERAQVAALSREARASLAAVAVAEARVAAGTYGSCLHCGGPIGHDRLEALPLTPSCIACAAGPGRSSI
jgi:DnaK suppressor protein